MIAVLFNILFFLIPLVFFKNTSELFEFNKIITLYALTILITTFWLIRIIKLKKIIFRRTILDIPLIGYLVVLLLSTLLSIDPRTSVFGYYSRFNGGLFSILSYSLLYWAFVSNLNKRQAIHTTYYILLSTAIASAMAVAEHFGINITCALMGQGVESCWVQDVQSRVFSTLGQPNWLAALLVALIPFMWRKSLKYYLLSILFFVTLLFTKSRSGFLAFGVSTVIFWGFVFWKEKQKYLKEFLILSVIFIVLFFIFKSSYSPEIGLETGLPASASSQAMQTGGTESGVIRKFVWLGAFEVFKHYPILGTGPETFAFAFPMFKPLEHNLTSEWDFIYNKAHNEYLNYLANTGVLGLVSYLILIIFSIIVIFRISDFKFRISIFAGYVSILITNFFGFSVVPISLLFFLFPAIAIVHNTQYSVISNKTKPSANQIIGIFFVLCAMCYLLYCAAKYWQADIYYNRSEISKALEISPKEPIYMAKLALTNNSVEIAKNALSLSPYNINIRRILISILIKNNDLINAEKILIEGIKISPNDPKLYYQLSLLDIKLNKLQDAILNLEKAIQIKPNYEDAGFVLEKLIPAAN